MCVFRKCVLGDGGVDDTLVDFRVIKPERENLGKE